MRNVIHSLLRVLTWLAILAAVATLIPNSSASKYCMLGYAALCSAVPLSTFILLLAAGALHAVNTSKFGSKADAKARTNA